MFCVLLTAVNKRRMHPSVVQWETFNEGGGMSSSEFVGEMVALVNKIDPTRPVDSASGGRDLCHNPPIQWQSCGRFGNFTDVHREWPRLIACTQPVLTPSAAAQTTPSQRHRVSLRAATRSGSWQHLR